MQPSDDLVALFSVLRRAATPADRARALARAWRTVRDLSPDERRWLAREVGFDGAEELVEGLAGKGRLGFAPAAVLEALGRARDGGSFSIRGLLADLGDPDRREELLARGVDLVADALAGDEETEAPPSVWTDGEAELEVPSRETGGGTDEPEESGEETKPEEDGSPEPVAAEPPELPAVLPPPAPREAEAPPLREPDPQPELEPSVWDEMWAPSEPLSVGGVMPPGAAGGEPVHDRPVLSAIRRLQQLRLEIESAGERDARSLREVLGRFPEPWARRRALTALIDAGVPTEAADALDLIESLDRAMDRRWCLAALARRGDLTGGDLDRALAMLDSPAGRRRIERLAGG